MHESAKCLLPLSHYCAATSATSCRCWQLRFYSFTNWRVLSISTSCCYSQFERRECLGSVCWWTGSDVVDLGFPSLFFYLPHETKWPSAPYEAAVWSSVWETSQFLWVPGALNVSSHHFSDWLNSEIMLEPLQVKKNTPAYPNSDANIRYDAAAVCVFSMMNVGVFK